MALTEIRYITRIKHPERVVVTSSKMVAHVFNTCHENITDIIDVMHDKTRHDLTLYSKLGQMFTEVNMVDDNGKEQLEYYMTKDGFILVMMKLTGNGNLENINLFWVIEYLRAFNLLQETLVKEQYKDEYLSNSPSTYLLISDLLSNASRQGREKLEAALTYYADYIPDRLSEIYRPDKVLKA